MSETKIDGVIVLSDTHINSTVSVCPPTVELDDGGTYRASRLQRALWDSFLDFRDTAARTITGRKILILNGDIAELDTKRRSTQLVTINKATITKLTLKALSPFFEIADHVIVLRGTMAHTGKGSWAEEMIANDLDNVIASSAEVKSWYHYRGTISGYKFDVAHHGRMGGVPWTERNAGIRLAAETFWQYSNHGWPLPDVVIRSHNHRRADSGRNFPFLAMFTPAWQAHTEFTYRIGRENSLADIGGDIFLCKPGGLEWKPIDYKPHNPGRRIWAASTI
jgi:hypothetical protein